MSGGLLFNVAERQMLTIASKTVALVVERGVSIGAQRLIWEEFFASRGRGTDWAIHLPWSADSETLCANAAISGSDDVVVAALIIRCVPDAPTAMIGYVCVDPAFRQQGLSGRLIDLAAKTLRGLGIDRMLLWTGKPGVYERVGFVVSGRERSITLCGATAGLTGPVTLTPWESSDKAIGLPPYATNGWRAALHDAQVVFVDTPMGAALLDHSGPPRAVLRAMFAVRPGDWSATLDGNHPLLRYAKTDCISVKDTPGPVTMYRALGETAYPPSYVPPLFRI